MQRILRYVMPGRDIHICRIAHPEAWAAATLIDGKHHGIAKLRVTLSQAPGFSTSAFTAEQPRQIARGQISGPLQQLWNPPWPLPSGANARSWQAVALRAWAMEWCVIHCVCSLEVEADAPVGEAGGRLDALLAKLLLLGFKDVSGDLVVDTIAKHLKMMVTAELGRQRFAVEACSDENEVERDPTHFVTTAAGSAVTWPISVKAEVQNE